MINHYAELQSATGLLIFTGFELAHHDEHRHGHHHHPAVGATPVRFTIEGGSDTGLTADSNVTLVLVNRYFLADVYQHQVVFQVPMELAVSQYDYSIFIGEINEFVVMQRHHADGSVTQCVPQIAVEVDGVWQIDPVQPDNQHNFNFTWWLQPNAPEAAAPSRTLGTPEP